MTRRTWRLSGALLINLVLLVSLATVALGAEYRASDQVVIGAGETIADDLYVAAGTTVVEGTVEGDLTVVSGTVDVRGTVNGSVNVTGGDVRVSGTVGGAVRSFGGNVTVAGDVGRDVVIAGGNVTIEQGATIGSDVAGAAGSLRIDGIVQGDVLAGAGELTLNGSVGGRIDANVGRLRIGSTAEVAGDVLYASEREAEISDQAEIGGMVERRDPEWAGYRALLPESPLTAFVGGFLGLLVLGWGLMLARPAWVLQPGGALQRRPLLAFGAGLATWVGQFLLIVALGILAALAATVASSFGGAFVVPLVIVVLLIVILLFVSQVYVAMAIGRALGRLDLVGSPWLVYALGALVWAGVLTLLGWLVGPLGGLVFFIGWILGLGAITVDTIERRRLETTPVPAEPAA
jgi:cytoskeletal protein CcmA (bactofilin family)